MGEEEQEHEQDKQRYEISSWSKIRRKLTTNTSSNRVDEFDGTEIYAPKK